MGYRSKPCPNCSISKQTNMDKCLIIGVILAFISYVQSLECFSCYEVDWNHGPCTGTTIRCLEYQDACITHIKYGVPDTDSLRADRVYYISKGCDTVRGCEQSKGALRTHCKRDWWRDWACVECCKGDLCNYYVKLGAGTVRAGVLTIIITSAAVLLSRWL